MEQKKIETQAERLSKELVNIKPDVTANDRKRIESELGYSKGTISNYLSGNVDNSDTAVNILTFLRGRIAEREKVIA